MSGQFLIVAEYGRAPTLISESAETLDAALGVALAMLTRFKVQRCRIQGPGLPPEGEVFTPAKRLSERQAHCLAGLPADGSYVRRGAGHFLSYCALLRHCLVKRSRDERGFLWARVIPSADYLLPE